MNERNSTPMKTAGMRPAFARKRMGPATFSVGAMKMNVKLPKVKVAKVKVPKFGKGDFSNMPNPGR